VAPRGRLPGPGPHSTSAGRAGGHGGETGQPWPCPGLPHAPRLSPVTWGGLTTACLRKGSLSPKGMMLPGLLPWCESSSSSCEPAGPAKPFSRLPGCTPFTRDAGDAASLARELRGGRAGVSQGLAAPRPLQPPRRSPWLQPLAHQALRPPQRPHAAGCLRLGEFFLLRHWPRTLLAAWGRRQSPRSAAAPGRSRAGGSRTGSRLRRPPAARGCSRLGEGATHLGHPPAWPLSRSPPACPPSSAGRAEP